MTGTLFFIGIVYLVGVIKPNIKVDDLLPLIIGGVVSMMFTSKLSLLIAAVLTVLCLKISLVVKEGIEKVKKPPPPKEKEPSEKERREAERREDERREAERREAERQEAERRAREDAARLAAERRAREDAARLAAERRMRNGGRGRGTQKPFNRITNDIYKGANKINNFIRSSDYRSFFELRK